MVTDPNNDPETWVQAGITHSRTGRHAEALAAFDRAIQLNPAYPGVYTLKGFELGILEQYEEALAAFDQALQLTPDDSGAYTGRGLALGELERYQEALIAYDHATTLDPNNVDAWSNKGDIFNTLKLYEEALAAFDQAIQLAPDNSRVYIGRGLALGVLKRYEEALAAFNHVLALDPHHIDAWNNKALALRALGRVSEATDAEQRAQELGRGDGIAPGRPASNVPGDPPLQDRKELHMPILTINGRPQSQPEGPGSLERRIRLFVECVRRLADDPLAQPAAAGRPIGDGFGLEGLVAKVAPLFTRERSLIRWVALRGAFTNLFITFLDPTGASVPPEQLEQVMGLDWIPDARGEFHPNLAQPWRTTLSPEQQKAAFGLASSVLTRVEDYARYSKMTVQEVNADPRCRIIDAVALDCIAWSAIACLRLEIAQAFFLHMPEPDALPAPGWYTEPLFAKAERFWDGSDWTDRCRVRKDNQFVETSVPLV